MAYHHPFLLNGSFWEVTRIIFLSLFAIIAFVVCLERYFFSSLTWLETVLWAGSAVLLIWPNNTINYISLFIFAALVLYQVFSSRRKTNKKQNDTSSLPGSQVALWKEDRSRFEASYPPTFCLWREPLNSEPVNAYWIFNTQLDAIRWILFIHFIMIYKNEIWL